jgi:hypothetical protein
MSAKDVRVGHMAADPTLEQIAHVARRIDAGDRFIARQTALVAQVRNPYGRRLAETVLQNFRDVHQQMTAELQTLRGTGDR